MSDQLRAEIVQSVTEILQSHSQRINALERFIWKLIVMSGIQLACLVLILVTR